MVERLRGNEEREKRERIEKGIRAGIEKRERDKKTIEEKEGLRDPPPPFFLEFLDLTLQCSHCYFKSSGYDKLELKHQTLVFTSL